jgi:hypothetical protein
VQRTDTAPSQNSQAEIRSSRPASARQLRAIEIRDRLMELMKERGRWDKQPRGGDVCWLNRDWRDHDDDCMAVFSIRPPCLITTTNDGLYSLEVWVKGHAKVLNLIWNSSGPTPTIVSFHRGAWELMLMTGNRAAAFVP